MSQQPWKLNRPMEMHAPDPATPDRLLRVKDVCDIVKCSDRALRRWVASGKFPPHDLKIGRNLRWRESTVDRFVQGEWKGD